MPGELYFKIRRRARIIYYNLPFKFLGEFRLLPLFFLIGAAMEFTMIHWHVGEVNFYKTYKKNRIKEAVENRLREMKAQAI